MAALPNPNCYKNFKQFLVFGFLLEIVVVASGANSGVRILNVKKFKSKHLFFLPQLFLVNSIFTKNYVNVKILLKIIRSFTRDFIL